MEGTHDQQLLSLNLLSESEEDNGTNSRWRVFCWQYSLQLLHYTSYLWRLCKSQYLCSILAGKNTDDERKKELIMQAVNTGQKAIQ